MPHPAADTIGFHLVDGASVRPLVKQIWEIDAGSDRDLNGRGEPGVDLHQVRDAGAVASELDFGVTLEVNFPHEPLGLFSDIGRHGDALAQDRLASLGLTTAGSPISFRAGGTSPTVLTARLRGTQIPSRFATAKVRCLLTATVIGGSLARAMRTRCSSRARC